MESKDQVELINLAIQQLREERQKNNDASAHDDQLLASTLLSQLESLQGDLVLQQPGDIIRQEETTSSAVGEVETEGKIAGRGGGDADEISREDIINELRQVKRQNFITHCLLSVMIVLTFAWQLSEVRMILSVRDGLNHPFKAVGSIFRRMFKPHGDSSQDAKEQQQQQQHESPSFSHFRMPELRQMDLPELGVNGQRH